MFLFLPIPTKKNQKFLNFFVGLDKDNLHFCYKEFTINIIFSMTFWLDFGNSAKGQRTELGFSERRVAE